MRLLYEGMSRLFKKIFGLKKNKLENLTVENIEKKLIELGFNKELADEITVTLNKGKNEYGEAKFKEWLNELNYRVPEDFQDERTAINIYDKYSQWVEDEISRLEDEMKLSWEKQSEDLKELDEKARKVQLILRQRLTEIVLDLMD
jgi:hypothetical protein